MVLITPHATVNYDPLGLVHPRLQANVFMRPEIEFASPGRPWVIVEDGGGWSQSSGLPVSAINSDTAPLLYKLWLLGVAIISSGYIVWDPAILGEGAFHPEVFRWNSFGDHLALNSKLANLQVRSGEACAVHLVQLIRLNGLNLDLDQSDFSGGWFGKSAGMMNGAFIGFGRSRADTDPAVTEDRYKKNTRLGWFMSQSTLFSWPAYANKNGITSVTHFGDGALGLEANMGAALSNATVMPNHGGQTYGELLGKTTSPFYYGFATTSVRSLNATMPVYLSNGPPIQIEGPYSWETTVDVLDMGVNAHPAESTLALQQKLLECEVEFGTNVHSTVSKFIINTTLEDLSDDQYEWILARFGLEPSDPADEQVLQALEAALRKIKAPLGDDAQPYRTTVYHVVRAELFNPSLYAMPAIMIHAISSNDDHEQGPNLVESTMRVMIDLWIAGIDDARRRTSEFIADVKNCLAHNEQLGGLCWRLDWTSVERWMREPESGSGFTAGATMMLEISYRTTRLDAYILSN